MARSILAGLLDLAFPPRCAGCGRPGAWFCPRCVAEVPWITSPICPHCGEAMPAGARCPRRGHHLLQLDGLRSAAWHAGPLRTAIHRYKYRGQRVLAGPLGAILAQAWRRDPPAVELLVPVPLHARRLRQRGFNQAALLARSLAREIGIPSDERSLERVRYTSPQVDLTAQERLLNVEDAFAYRGRTLAGRAVCLIDDICTTGATLQACAAALRAAGARFVWAFTLARPYWETGKPDR